MTLDLPSSQDPVVTRQHQLENLGLRPPIENGTLLLHK